MRNREWIAAIILFAVVVLCAASLASGIAGAANTIDTAHWDGGAVAPCFVNAIKCGGHILGLDESGRDLFARLIVAVLVSLGVALANAAVAITLGAALFRVRWSQWFTKWWWSLFALWFGGGIVTLAAGSLLAECTIFGALLFMPVAIAVREDAFPRGVFAACSRVARWSLAGAAMVDFIGYGIQAPWPSLGNMLANAEPNMEVAWWAAAFPLTMLVLIIVLLKIVGSEAQHG